MSETLDCLNCGHEMVYEEGPYHDWYRCEFKYCPVGRDSGHRPSHLESVANRFKCTATEGKAE